MTLTENITWKRFNKLWIVCLKVLFLRDGQLATTTKCQNAILCQKQTEENLVCPLENPVASRREGAYTDMIGLVSQFRAIGAAPHPNIELPDAELMHQNRASWHKSCHQL